MKILELFSGTESFSKVARKRGHFSFTIDSDYIFNPSMCINILNIDPVFFSNFGIDIIWASPPCQAFSVATISKNWRDKKPISEKAKYSIKLIEKTLQFIDILKPRFFFIENPRAMLRTLDIMKDIPRHTVTYCQYGDKRMKATDIWTNSRLWNPKPPCKRGMTCHEPAPRGSHKTGTQGLKDPVERGKIPWKLCLEIIKACEKEFPTPPKKGKN